MGAPEFVALGAQDRNLQVVPNGETAQLERRSGL